MWEDFRRELAIGCILSLAGNEYIVKCFGGSIKDKLFVVTEYMSHGSLRENSRGKNLDTRLVLNYSLHIAKGMSFLHQLSIIHR